MKKFLLETKKCPSFNEFENRSLTFKSQYFLPLRSNHGSPLRVTTFIKNEKNCPTFQKSTLALSNFCSIPY